MPAEPDQTSELLPEELEVEPDPCEPEDSEAAPLGPPGQQCLQMASYSDGPGQVAPCSWKWRNPFPGRLPQRGTKWSLRNPFLSVNETA